MSYIGAKIKERRLALGMTQEELAIKIGYKSKTTINKIELGINEIPLKKIDSFAKALATSPSYLLGKDGFYFKFDENGNTTESLYVSSSKYGMHIYHFDSDFLFENNNIDKLLIEASKEYFPNIEKMDIHERADIYNSLYSCVVYNENNNTVSVYPFLPTELLEPYNKLNSKGKEKAIEQIDMLTKIDEYTKNDEST